MKTLKKIFHHWPLFIIAIVIGALFIANFKPGTWLIGWDSYSPNLNFLANIQRNIFGVWQTDRGLGLLDGMSHVANVLHTSIIYLFSLVLPANILRYVFQFLCLGTGAIGFYFLAYFLLKKQLPALIAALFYMLNLGTIQMFYLPLEVFSVHFAALPWLTLSLLSYLKKPRYASAFWFFMLSFLFTPQSYVPTVFAVYAFVLFMICLFYIGTQKFFKKTLTVFFITLAVNAFWAIPYAYSMTKNVSVISNAKINQLSNEAILENNKEFGDLKSVATIKGLYLSFLNQTDPQHPKFVMYEWLQHFQQPVTNIIAWGFFVIALIGLILILFKRKREFLPFAFLFVFAFLMLGNDIPYLSSFFNFFDQYVPIFGSAYRFVFTKFSLLYVFTFSILCAVAIDFLLTRIQVIRVLLSCIFVAAIVFYAWPAFTGHLFYNQLQLRVPQDYFDLTNFFNHQPSDERISILPTTDLWGWTYNSWGFVGSGFIWQALPQPVMDGAFLPWSSNNETYYLETTQALFAKDLPTFEKTLQKYQIRWIVLDPTIGMNSTPQNHEPDFSVVKDLVTHSSEITFEKQFGTLEVYKVGLSTPQHILPTNTDTLYTKKDIAFQTIGHYVSDINNKTSVILYPFSRLLTDRSLQNTQQPNDNQLGFSTAMPENTDYQLELPSTLANEKHLYFVQAEMRNGNLILHFLYPYEIQNDRGEPLFSDLITDLVIPTDNQYQQYMVQIGSSQVMVNKDPSQNSLTTIQLNSFGTFDTTVFGLTKLKDQDGKPNFLADKIQTADISSKFWDQVTAVESKKYPLHSSSVNVTFLTVPISANVHASQLTYNCDVFARGAIKKQDNDSSVIYTSENRGSLCDNFAFPALDHSYDYIFRIVGKNDQNRSVNLYVHDWSNEKNDVETLLPKGNFDEYFSVLGKSFLGGNGESVNVETRSFLRQKSQNEVQQIVFYPLELQKAAEIQVVPSDLVAFTNVKTLKNQGALDTHMLETRISFDDGPGVLLFPQSFDSGWIAFIKPTKFAPLKLFQHVKYDGWANAWLLPKGEWNVVIIYWPQFLSFAGYGILALTFIGFIMVGLINLKNRRSNKKLTTILHHHLATKRSAQNTSQKIRK